MKNVYISQNEHHSTAAVVKRLFIMSSWDENLDNKVVVRLYTRLIITCHIIVYVCVCCTCCLQKTDLLTLLQMQKAVVVSLTAAVDEGSAGLSVSIEVPAHSVSSAAALLQWQQAHVCITHGETGMRPPHWLGQTLIH